MSVLPPSNRPMNVISEVDTAVQDARLAERDGFDYVGCGEHPFFHGPTPNAFMAASLAANRAA